MEPHQVFLKPLEVWDKGITFTVFVCASHGGTQLSTKEGGCLSSFKVNGRVREGL